MPHHYEEIAKRLKDGMMVPFFGAGASIACGLPSGRALAERLVRESQYPDPADRDNLALVASYLAVRTRDDYTLKNAVHQALAVDAQPGRLHRCLAGVQLDALRLFVTTNYDDLIERALEPRTPWVVVDRGVWGNVLVRRAGGEWREIEAGQLGREITDLRALVVLKLHGTLDRNDRANESFVITEEDYVDFLGRAAGEQMPPMLFNRLRERSFLFLGYGLKDWNVRVLLHKLAQTRPPNVQIRSWAVVREPSLAEQELWRAHNVEMLDVDLESFAAGLEPLL